jgi:TRAP-type uncharacterized transport system substrate-binding protein
VIRRRALIVLLIVAGILASLIGFVLVTINTDTRITLGTGLKGSLSYNTAVAIKAGLEAEGFDVDIITTEQTMGLIERLEDPNDPIDITFIADEVNGSSYTNIDSLGTVARQPFLFATMPGAHDITSLAEVEGRRIDLGPEGSVRADFSRKTLEAFGITAENSTFLNLPATAGMRELTLARVEVVTGRWDDSRPFVVDEFISGRLRLIPIPEAEALSGFIKSAEAVEIPIGAVQVNPPFPEETTPTIAQLMTVIGGEKLSPAADYAVARELVANFSAGTQFSDPGEFPNFIDRQFPINPEAADYYATGSVPWQYAHLPPLLADSFVSLIILGTTLLLLASVYSLFLPEVYSLWNGIIKPRSEERYIAAMEAALAEGRELTLRQRTRLAEILERQDSEAVLRQRADNLRPRLSAPIDDETDNDVDPSSGDVLGERRAPQTPSDR